MIGEDMEWPAISGQMIAHPNLRPVSPGASRCRDYVSRDLLREILDSEEEQYTTGWRRSCN